MLATGMTTVTFGKEMPLKERIHDDRGFTDGIVPSLAGQVSGRGACVRVSRRIPHALVTALAHLKETSLKRL